MRKFLQYGLRSLNKLLGGFGLKIKRAEQPTRDFPVFFAHIKRLGWDFKTIVDVGIAFGTESIYRAYPQANYFLVEPLEECRPVLEKLKARLRATYFLAAVGDADGNATFHVHPDLSGSSLLNQAEGPVMDGVPRTVNVRRLDTLLPSVLERPLMIKLDTQGAELQAISGLGALLSQVDMLIIETSLMRFRANAPDFAEVVAQMKSLNYVVYDILEGHNRALDGALAQIDLVFVREDCELRVNHSFFSLEQAEHYSRT